MLGRVRELDFVMAWVRGAWSGGSAWSRTATGLGEAGLLQLVGGGAMAPQGPTCGDRCIDFFVIERRLRPYVVAVQRLEGAGTSPHCPVRILMDGACRRDMVRTVRSPTKIGACLPLGCLSEESASAAPVLETCAEAQLRRS